MTEYTVCCPHCDISMTEDMLLSHEPLCMSNPKNIKKCSRCNEPSITNKDGYEYCYGCYMNFCYCSK